MTSNAENNYIDELRNIIQSNYSGGTSKSKKAELTKKFNKYTLDKLQKYAKNKGIKINKRENGKLVNIRKATLVSKLVKLYL